MGFGVGGFGFKVHACRIERVPSILRLLCRMLAEPVLHVHLITNSLALEGNFSASNCMKSEVFVAKTLNLNPIWV